MGQTEASRQADFITPPRAGQVTVLAASSSAGSFDLRLGGIQTANMGTATGGPVAGLPGHYVTLQADGGKVYVSFGATSASVTSGNAPLDTATGTNATQGCALIPDGAFMTVKLEQTLDLWLGYVCPAGVTANLRVFKSSI